MYLPDVLLSFSDFFFFLGALTFDSLTMFDGFEGEYVHDSEQDIHICMYFSLFLFFSSNC